MAYYEDLLNNKKSNPEYIIYTHCEIHNSMIFGASGATIPFAECNQGIRIIYGSNQKQGLGTYATITEIEWIQQDKFLDFHKYL